MTNDERTGYRSGDRSGGLRGYPAHPDPAAPARYPARSPARPQAPPNADDVAPDPLCERCGAVMLDRHCKLVCTRCGYQRDCSDP